MTARYLASLTVPLRRPEEYGLAAHAATIWPAFGEAVATAVRGGQADFHLAARLMYSKWANPWVELICRDGQVRVERADPLDDETYARRVLLDEGGDLTGAVREVLGGTRLWAGQAEVGGTGIGPSARVGCRDGGRYAAARFWFIHGDYNRAADRFFRWLWRPPRAGSAGEGGSTVPRSSGGSSDRRPSPRGSDISPTGYLSRERCRNMKTPNDAGRMPRPVARSSSACGAGTPGGGRTRANCAACTFIPSERDASQSPATEVRAVLYEQTPGAGIGVAPVGDRW